MAKITFELFQDPSINFSYDPDAVNGTFSYI